MSDDLVKSLRARGFDAEADRIEILEQRCRELEGEVARLSIDGLGKTFNAATIEQILKATQARAEAAEARAERLRAELDAAHAEDNKQ